MIRRTPLRSTTPLRRGGALKRTPLARRTPLTSRPAPAATASTVRAARRRRVTGPDAETTWLLWERAGGCCERCGRDLVDQVASRHHRQPRGMGGSTRDDVNALSNLMLLCGSGTTGCHGWVEGNRLSAIAHGFLVPRGYMPAEVPVVVMVRPSFAPVVAVPVPMWLTDEGEYAQEAP